MALRAEQIFLPDIDSSGSISRQEVSAFAQIVKSVMELSGNGFGNSKRNPVMTARKILASIFRVFDDNGNGNIEAEELERIVGSWITTIFNLGTDFVAMIEDIIKADAVKKAALQIGLGLQSIARSGDSDSIDIEKTLQSILESMPDEAPQAIASTVTGSWTNAKGEIKYLVPDIDERSKRATDKYNQLIQKFQADAEKAEIKKADIVAQSTVVFCEIIELFLSTDVLARTVSRPLDLLNEFFLEKTPITEGVSKQLSAELLDSLVSHLRQFFRGGGLDQTLKTFFDLFDVNNNQSWSRQELTDLGNISSLITRVR